MSALFLLCAAVCSEPSWLGLPAPRVPEKGKMTGFPIGAPFGASEPVWEYSSGLDCRGTSQSSPKIMGGLSRIPDLMRFWRIKGGRQHISPIS